jgi:hypothetical protein
MSDSSFKRNDGPIVKYELKPENPGLVYIFNNRLFLNDEIRKEKFLYRVGSNRNVKNLEKLFKEMNFTVEKFIDYKAFGIGQIIDEITTKTDYTNVDSLFVFIMSHGHIDEFGNHHILTYDEQYVNVDEFIEPFKNVDSLKGKPKFFFIDACRGLNVMPTVERVKKSELKKIANEKPANEKEIGVDFVILHSTVHNYYSFSTILQGSWFMHSLCLMITKYKETRDFSSIMFEVGNHVQKKEYLDDDNRIYKMFPSCKYRLSKSFKFPVILNFLVYIFIEKR